MPTALSKPKKPGKSYRVILDTNWFVSASLSRQSRQTLKLILSDFRFRVYVCQELIDEFDGVINRPRFRKYISLSTVGRFQDLLLRRVEKATIKTFIASNRDPKDSYLLDLARETNANYLITGDPDLLTEPKPGMTTILTMRSFMTRFRIR